MLSNYSDYTNTILRDTAFANSLSLARSSRAANCLLSLGTILSLTSLIMSVWFHLPIFGFGSLAFVPSSGLIRVIYGYSWARFAYASAGVLAPISVFVGSTIWQAIIKKAKDVNSQTVQPAHIPLGIKVTTGAGLTYAWIAFGFLVAGAIIPGIESVSFFRLITRLQSSDPLLFLRSLMVWFHHPRGRSLPRRAPRRRGPSWRRILPWNWSWITRNRTGRSPYAAQPERSY